MRRSIGMSARAGDSTRWASAARCFALAAALAAFGIADGGLPSLLASPAGRETPGVEAPRTGRTSRIGSASAGAVQHPIEVRVRPLDPIRRGAIVRLEVRASARAAIGGAEVRLVSPGGAIVEGSRRLPLGRITPARDATGTFRVTVPAGAGRFLVQFVVSGEGPTGLLTRGAVYNLLPDGPFDPGREVTAGDGTRIREFAATRSGR